MPTGFVVYCAASAAIAIAVHAAIRRYVAATAIAALVAGMAPVINWIRRSCPDPFGLIKRMFATALSAFIAAVAGLPFLY